MILEICTREEQQMILDIIIIIIIMMNTSQHTNTSIVKCCCGKQCKGLRGLKAHQRSCRTLFDLQKDILEDIEYNQSENNDVSDIDIENQINSLPDVKAGVKLPKTDNHWNIANSYFKSTLPVSSIDIEDLNATIKCMNNIKSNAFITTSKIITEQSKPIPTKFTMKITKNLINTNLNVN